MGVKIRAINQPTRTAKQFQGLRRNPCSREPAVLRPRAFSLTPRQHCKAFAAKRKFFVKDEAKPPRTGSRRYRERKRSFMKFGNVSKGLLLGLALLLATSVFAASNKGSMQLLDPVTVSGKQLPAGDYSVKWDGSGPNVELNILKGNKVVATTPARLIDLNQKANNDAAVVKSNDDGSRSLAEIHFGGKKYGLAIGQETAMDGSGSSK
jgi:hypothetical protein